MKNFPDRPVCACPQSCCAVCCMDILASWIFLVKNNYMPLLSPFACRLIFPKGFSAPRENGDRSSGGRAFVLPRACLCFPEDACQYLQDVLEYAYAVFCFCLLVSELCLPVRNWCFFWHAYFCVFGELCPCPC